MYHDLYRIIGSYLNNIIDLWNYRNANIKILQSISKKWIENFMSQLIIQRLKELKLKLLLEDLQQNETIIAGPFLLQCLLGEKLENVRINKFSFTPFSSCEMCSKLYQKKPIAHGKDSYEKKLHNVIDIVIHHDYVKFVKNLFKLSVFQLIFDGFRVQILCPLVNIINKKVNWTMHKSLALMTITEMDQLFDKGFRFYRKQELIKRCENEKDKAIHNDHPERILKIQTFINKLIYLNYNYNSCHKYHVTIVL